MTVSSSAFLVSLNSAIKSSVLGSVSIVILDPLRKKKLAKAIDIALLRRLFSDLLFRMFEVATTN